MNFLFDDPKFSDVREMSWRRLVRLASMPYGGSSSRLESRPPLIARCTEMKRSVSLVSLHIVDEFQLKAERGKNPDAKWVVH